MLQSGLKLLMKLQARTPIGCLKPYILQSQIFRIKFIVHSSLLVQSGLNLFCSYIRQFCFGLSVGSCCFKAHWTCSRTKGESSLYRAFNASEISLEDEALPNPTAKLRSHCSCPIRRIGLPASLVSNSSLLQPNNSTRDALSRPLRTEKSLSPVTAAYLFQGQIS